MTGQRVVVIVIKTNCIFRMMMLTLFIISISLLVVYRESVNLIGYITRRQSADSLRQDSCSSKFILKQLDYSPSFSTSDSPLGCVSLTICS